ncbi:MAG: hypothetical protein L0099_00720 [Acidobacteria bacterium]|nr:hypothetical protein [Acidobacteriota bacterium]
MLTRAIRFIVTSNFILLGVLYLRTVLVELKDMPDVALALVLRAVVRAIAVVVELVSPLARIWVVACTMLLPVLWLVEAASLLRSKRAATKEGGSVWVDTLLVGLWLLTFWLAQRLGVL